MKTLFLALILALVGPNPSYAQDASLDRDEVAVIKKKLVTVQTALGDDPDGYVLDSEEFNLPTDFNPAQAGKFRPIRSSLSLRYSDKASKNSQAGVEKAAEDFQARYSAAIASGDQAAMMKMMEEMQMMATQAAAASMAPQNSRCRFTFDSIRAAAPVSTLTPWCLKGPESLPSEKKS